MSPAVNAERPAVRRVGPARAARALALAAALAAATLPAAAQTAGDAPAGGRKEVVQKILQLQQPAVESTARQLVELPAAQLLQRAGPELQRLPADKREGVAAEIQSDARRYVEETLPVVRERALKAAPEVIGPILEARLSDDELRQVLQVMQLMESPAYRKYNSLGPELQRALSDRIVTDSRGVVEPKMRAFQESVAKRLGLPPRTPPASTGGAATPKKP